MPTILTHIPVWVFPLFLYIAYMSLRATRGRVASLPRLLMVPALFIVWGVSGLLSRHQIDLPLGSTWVAAAGLGAGLALTIGKPIVLGVDRERGLLRLAGSWAPFVRVMAIFIAKFTLGAMNAMRPDLREMLAFADAAVSGTSVGFFLFWAVGLYTAYTAPLERPMIQR